MILLQAGLLHIFKAFCIAVLSCAILGCVVLLYAYISGSHVDRDEMTATASNLMRVIPSAEAQGRSSEL